MIIIFFCFGITDPFLRQCTPPKNSSSRLRHFLSQIFSDAKKIVLLGRCKSGKSVTGDIILGKQVFHSDEQTLATKYYFVDIDGLHLQVSLEKYICANNNFNIVLYV